jgi:hypothetical protein
MVIALLYNTPSFLGEGKKMSHCKTAGLKDLFFRKKLCNTS